MRHRGNLLLRRILIIFWRPGTSQISEGGVRSLSDQCYLLRMYFCKSSNREAHPDPTTGAVYPTPMNTYSTILPTTILYLDPYLGCYCKVVKRVPDLQYAGANRTARGYEPLLGPARAHAVLRVQCDSEVFTNRLRLSGALNYQPPAGQLRPVPRSMNRNPP